ncbi:MAG: hypothetical protein JWM97_2802, partial [Phycisphaerales bacterium]|nr:hypothetical protein [Phycisphaerales bacterium]
AAHSDSHVAARLSPSGVARPIPVMMGTMDTMNGFVAVKVL